MTLDLMASVVDNNDFEDDMDHREMEDEQIDQVACFAPEVDYTHDIADFALDDEDQEI